ncbi:MAG: slipin family protein, partial [Alphaproteobacteria bacterium]|nr:slipin family protein [Alphaproteobacteria bacterium]
IINAEGEQQAAQKLSEAAEILETQEKAMQLRYLSALSEISANRASTIVLPLPVEAFDFLATKAKQAREDDQA